LLVTSGVPWLPFDLLQDGSIADHVQWDAKIPFGEALPRS
jgi:hypothetical protein